MLNDEAIKQAAILTKGHYNGTGDAVGHTDGNDTHGPRILQTKLELIGLALQVERESERARERERKRESESERERESESEKETNKTYHNSHRKLHFNRV